MPKPYPQSIIPRGNYRYRLPRHLPFAPSLDLVKDEWDGHSEPSFPLAAGDYKVEEEWGIIGFRVSVVNSFAFPYTKAVDKKDYANVVKASERIRKREKLDIDGEIVGMFGQAENQLTTVHAWLHVNHHPSLLNYWHMQIDVYPAGSEAYLLHGNKSGEARRIRHRFREFLSRIAICEFDYSYHIGSRYYRHSAGCMTNLFDDGLNNLCRRFVRFPKV